MLRRLANSCCQRSFHFSNVLCTALSVNIPHQVPPLTFDVKNWFREIRISARWRSFDTRKFANFRFQRSFRFSNVPHPTLLIFLTRSSPPSWSRHKWISPGDKALGVYSKAAWRYFPRVVVESESIALKLNIWREYIRPTVSNLP